MHEPYLFTTLGPGKGHILLDILAVYANTLKQSFIDVKNNEVYGDLWLR